MNKTFCVSCGSKNLYEATKPKFCAHCGEPVDGAVVASSKVDSVEEESDAPVNIGSIDLDKLRRGISAEANTTPTKIEELLGTADPNEKKYSRKGSSLPEGKDIFNQNVADVAPASRFKDIDER
jgi:hypothetical protein